MVSPEIACDLMMECKRIGEGRLQCPDVLGTFFVCFLFFFPNICLVCVLDVCVHIYMDGCTCAYKMVVLHTPPTPTTTPKPPTPHTGNVAIDPIFPGEAYDVYLSGDKMQRAERAELIRAYRKRVPFQTNKGEGGEGGGGSSVDGKKGRGKRGGGGEMDENDAFFHYN